MSDGAISITHVKSHVKSLERLPQANVAAPVTTRVEHTVVPDTDRVTTTPQNKSPAKPAALVGDDNSVAHMRDAIDRKYQKQEREDHALLAGGLTAWGGVSGTIMTAACVKEGLLNPVVLGMRLKPNSILAIGIVATAVIAGTVYEAKK